MSDKTEIETDRTGANTRADFNANATDAESQREMRERVVRLVFAGDQRRYDEFIKELSEATPPDVEVILRGSAVTGHKFGTDEPFDGEGPGTSDMDITFVGGDMVMLFREFHIPGVHSAPLSEEHPFASPTLAPLRKRLCEMTGRAVNLQATTSLVQFLRDWAMDQPYLVLLCKPKADDAKESAD
ncbi:MAG TPA: hypothetical protein VJS39_02945 [Gemmatimonadaceae bacterium]|nr:hypothetical protein [Gemmatimonadaceae bacterium]